MFKLELFDVFVHETVNKFTGSDAILLGAETLRGLYPVETISTVGRICSEVSLFHISLILFNTLYLFETIDVLTKILSPYVGPLLPS